MNQDYICPQCGEYLSEPSELFSHLLTSCSQQQLLSCLEFFDQDDSKVPKVVKSPERKENSLGPQPKENINDAKSPYLCVECEIDLKTEKRFQGHEKIVHKRNLICRNCGQCFDWLGMVNHFGKSLPKKYFIRNCIFCEKHVAKRFSLVIHYFKLHQRDVLQDSDFTWLCYKPSEHESKSNSASNIKATQTNADLLQCKNCEYSFPKMDNLLTHVVDSHLKYIKIPCEICNEMFSKKSRLMKHVILKHLITSAEKNWRLSCKLCDTPTFSKPNAMVKHINNQHPINLFRCKTCGLQFFTTSVLAEHVLQKHRRIAVKFLNAQDLFVKYAAESLQLISLEDEINIRLRIE